MGADLVAAFPEAQAVFDEADAVLGFSLSKLCFEGPGEDLTLTSNAQPAILTTSIAALRVLEAHTGVKPDVVAGHSLGEFSALVAAGCLSFADAVLLVHKRGKFMQDAVPAGEGMAAILGLDEAKVAEVCAEIAKDEDAILSPANLNGGGQVVIAGAKGAVEKPAFASKPRARNAHCL